MKRVSSNNNIDSFVISKDIRKHISNAKKHMIAGIILIVVGIILIPVGGILCSGCGLISAYRSYTAISPYISGRDSYGRYMIPSKIANIIGYILLFIICSMLIFLKAAYTHSFIF